MMMRDKVSITEGKKCSSKLFPAEGFFEKQIAGIMEIFFFLLFIGID
jgi:hypothetical protein